MDHNHTEEIQRLKKVVGYTRGIPRMLKENQYFSDIIQQFQAVQSALNKISTITLDEHLNTWLLSITQGDNPLEKQRVLNEITEVFETANKA